MQRQPVMLSPPEADEASELMRLFALPALGGQAQSDKQDESSTALMF